MQKDIDKKKQQTGRSRQRDKYDVKKQTDRQTER